MALSCACKKTAPALVEVPDLPPMLGLVSVLPASALTESGVPLTLDVDALAAQVRNELHKARIFADPLPDGGASAGGIARVRVEVALEDVAVEKKGAARAAIRLRIDARPSDTVAPHWNEDVQAGSETLYQVGPQKEKASEKDLLFQKLVSRTLHDLLEGYVARQKLWSADAPALHKAATADAGELRVEAIRAIGERRISSEAETLLRLLDHEDEPTRDAALGGLVKMRDRRTVAALGKSRSMKDRREMRKILDAMATLGGDEAADYLSFVADAHEDEDIRKMAKDAQERLKRRTEAEKAEKK